MTRCNFRFVKDKRFLKVKVSFCRLRWSGKRIRWGFMLFYHWISCWVHTIDKSRIFAIFLFTVESFCTLPIKLLFTRGFRFRTWRWWKDSSIWQESKWLSRNPSCSQASPLAHSKWRELCFPEAQVLRNSVTEARTNDPSVFELRLDKVADILKSELESNSNQIKSRAVC